jgi:hypothetical protein
MTNNRGRGTHFAIFFFLSFSLLSTSFFNRLGAQFSLFFLLLSSLLHSTSLSSEVSWLYGARGPRLSFRSEKISASWMQTAIPVAPHKLDDRTHVEQQQWHPKLYYFVTDGGRVCGSILQFVRGLQGSGLYPGCIEFFFLIKLPLMVQDSRRSTSFLVNISLIG